MALCVGLTSNPGARGNLFMCFHVCVGEINWWWVEEVSVCGCVCMCDGGKAVIILPVMCLASPRDEAAVPLIKSHVRILKQRECLSPLLSPSLKARENPPHCMLIQTRKFLHLHGYKCVLFKKVMNWTSS